ncbi:hypothetical protein, partial [Winslowiella toletana]|uniref:hypothetical protein n=1 Tax=Winslowiella toletana TaxID=92490 RepID=UPI0019D6E9AE
PAFIKFLLPLRASGQLLDRNDYLQGNAHNLQHYQQNKQTNHSGFFLLWKSATRRLCLWISPHDAYPAN